MITIAVDPDLEKSGVAVYRTGYDISYSTKPLPELVNFITNLKDKVKVIIEAGWLNQKSNFHTIHGRAGEKIAKNVGENHATGKLLAEFLKYNKVDFQLQLPLRKKWTGPSGKITHKELNNVLAGRGFEELKHTNQDQRDAILILLQHI